ncbi:hypothetical protein V2J09_000132 [Rumex salicifolius]
MGSVRLGDDKTCGIVGIGQIKVCMPDGIIRMLTENLISLGTLHVNGFDYKSDSFCVKLSKGALMITTGRVYRLIGSTIVGGVIVAVSESDNTALWHLRMEHVREHCLTELQKRGLLAVLKSCKMRFCKFCVMGETAKKAVGCKWVFKKKPNVKQGGVQLHYSS